MLLDIAIFIVSLVLLIKGADYFVDSASIIAMKLGVSQLLIGLTVVSIGTSLPELGAAVAASFSKNSKIVLGDIIGSNIANIALVMAVGLLICANGDKMKDSLRKLSHFLLWATSLYFIVSLWGVIPRAVGILLLALFVLMIQSLKEQKGLFLADADIGKKEEKKSKMPRQIMILVGSGFLIFLGSKLIIPSASNIAADLGVSDLIIGLFAIAIGTSLPELAVTLSTLKKGKFDIFIGNIVGSNLSNLLLIGGLAALVNPTVIDHLSLWFAMPVMLFLTLLLFMMFKFKWKIKRMDGIALLVFYSMFIIASFFLGGFAN